MNKNVLAEIPAVPAALSLIGGIAAGYFLLGAVSLKWIGIVVALGIVSAGCLFRFRIIALSILTLTIGIFLGHEAIPNPLPHEIADSSGTISGKVIKTDRTADDLRAVVLVDTWLPKNDSIVRETNFKTLCIFKSSVSPITIGSSITAEGKINGTEYDPDLPFELNYNRFLFIDGVVGRMTVYGNEYSVNNSEISSWQRFIDRARSKWLWAIVDAGFNEPTTYFLLAVIGGEDILLGESVEEQFRQAGLSHILAISGLHVGIILMALLLILYPVKLIRRFRSVYFILPALLIIFYALIIGGTPSACRAVAMCCIVLGNKIFETKTNAFQSLAVAIIALLCVKPLWIFLPAFQFSVFAVLSIIAFSPLFKIIPNRFRILQKLWTIVLMPVVAVAGTLALTLYYFHSFAINFWISNIIAAVLVPILILIGFIASVLSLLGLYSGLLTFAGNIIYTSMAYCIHFISKVLPDNTLHLYLGIESLIAIILIVIMLAWLIRNYSHLRAVTVVLETVIAVVLIIIFSGEASPTSELYIPRHRKSTDIIIVHNGKSYIWTTAQNDIDKKILQEDCTTFYGDFYKRRKLETPPHIAPDSFEWEQCRLRNNILTIDNRTLARIDNDTCLPDEHVEIALISDLYRGNIPDLIKTIDADSIMLSPAINHMTRQKFLRQLDTLQVNFRDLYDKSLVWQSQ